MVWFIVIVVVMVVVMIEFKLIEFLVMYNFINFCDENWRRGYYL